MIRAVLLRGAPDVLRFVKTSSKKRDGERLYGPRRSSRGIVQDRRRIDAAAQPQPKRHVGKQMLVNGLLQKGVEFLTRGVERAFANRSRRQIPVRLDAHFSIEPLEPLSRRQLLDSLDQGPRARNIVER